LRASSSEFGVLDDEFVASGDEFHHGPPTQDFPFLSNDLSFTTSTSPNLSLDFIDETSFLATKYPETLSQDSTLSSLAELQANNVSYTGEQMVENHTEERYNAVVSAENEIFNIHDIPIEIVESSQILDTNTAELVQLDFSDLEKLLPPSVSPTNFEVDSGYYASSSGGETDSNNSEPGNSPHHDFNMDEETSSSDATDVEIRNPQILNDIVRMLGIDSASVVTETANARKPLTDKERAERQRETCKKYREKKKKLLTNEEETLKIEELKNKMLKEKVGRLENKVTKLKNYYIGKIRSKEISYQP